MKLIDILVRELPKLGGWPGGAVECVRFVDEATIDFYDEHGNWPDDCSITYGPIARAICITPTEPCQRETVKFSEYEAALAASKTEWDGAFPIPAGTEVEVHFEGDDSRVWTQFRVEYMRGEIVVLYDYRIDNVDAYNNKTLNFRPIHSEADKKRDEIIEALREGLGHAHGLFDIMQIYHLLNNGKIPHIRIN